MSDIELLPCPHCGGKAKIKPAGFYLHIECCECQSRGKPFNTDTSDFTYNAKEEAIAAWNTRIDRWIPVSERLPEKSKIVLVCCIDQIVSTGYFDGEWEIFGKRLSRRHPSVDVAYWKPITLPGE